MSLLGSGIILFESSGYSTLEDEKQLFAHVDRLIADQIGPSNPYVFLVDLSKLQGTSLAARALVIEETLSRERLAGLVFFCASAALRLSIGLAKRLSLLRLGHRVVEVAEHYAEGVRLAQALLVGSGPTARIEAASGDPHSGADSLTSVRPLAGALPSKREWDAVSGRRVGLSTGLFSVARSVSRAGAKLLGYLPSALVDHLALPPKRARSGSASRPDMRLYLDELLQFLGSIRWETDGVEASAVRVGVNHPFRPAYDAIELVKHDLDNMHRERAEAETKLRYHLELEKAVARISRLLLAPSSPSLEDVLEILGAVFRSSGTHIFQFRDDQQTLYNTFDWRSPAAMPRPKSFYDLGASFFPQWGEQLGVGENILIDDVEALPAEQATVLAAGGVAALTTVPIFVEERLFGLLGLDCAVPRRWSQHEAWILRMVGEIIGKDLERRQMRERLGRRDRMASVGMLAAGIAHQINNPLAYLVSNIEFLTDNLSTAESERPELDRDLASCAKEALDGARRVARIVSDLKIFSYAREEEGSPLQLEAVIEAALDIVNTEIKYRARVHREYASLPTIVGSKTRLCQVFVNLLVNAAHRIDEGNREDNLISVRTWSTDHEVLAEVQDTGRGISKALRERIFEPFSTAHAVDLGTGLGLAIADSIVKSYRGQIEVESSPGEGTRFVVHLPWSEVGKPARARNFVERKADTVSGSR